MRSLANANVYLTNSTVRPTNLSPYTLDSFDWHVKEVIL